MVQSGMTVLESGCAILPGYTYLSIVYSSTLRNVLLLLNKARFTSFKSGVAVNEVQLGSAARRSGLRVGDIIRSVNAIQLLSAEQLNMQVSSHVSHIILKLIITALLNFLVFRAHFLLRILERLYN